MKQSVLVVGSGIAGLIAALELSRGFDVTLVTKAKLADSNTRWAQGGIAAVMFEDDSVAEHIADTLRAGAGLCQREPVEILCAEGPARIRDLIRLGVAFDRKGEELARGLEAAHSHARVLHAGGDATGLSIEMALVTAVRGSGVRVLEHTFAVDLVKRGDRVLGLDVLLPDGRLERLDAEAVVLASGGAGQMYRHTTNPSVATGDGVAMALRAGAELADVEFYQFHPTALATGVSGPGGVGGASETQIRFGSDKQKGIGQGTFLISEAVRGDGGVLLDAQGRRFMQAIHADAELAPRDVVARGIAMQMAAQGGQPVRLDATRLGPPGRTADFLRERFPTIDRACRERGLDWATEPIPVTPAAHYWMGGVRTDVWGRTSVPGLFAVGEVACTGVHGANRLASNSLLESLVFAWRAAELLLEQGVDAAWPEMGLAARLPEFEVARMAVKVDRGALQELMWRAVGIERTGEGLRSAAEQLGRWRGDFSGDVVALETANLLALARVVVGSALARTESRGAHFREDFPGVDSAQAQSIVVEQRVGVRC
jgi:L-aspartate oxidase